MCFLLQHFNKINSKNQTATNIVCDFSFLLDKIYASILLSDRELIVYNELLSYIISQINPPDYVIKLTCPNNVIVDRINTRNRSYERNINESFIKELNLRINNFKTNYKQIQINSAEIDFFNIDEVYEKIVKRII